MNIVRSHNHNPNQRTQTCVCRHAVLATLFFIAMSFVLLPIQKVTASQMTTSTIKTLIVKEAQKSKYVAPSLALAVAYVESSFRADAISPAGAIGVMQIMPRTGRTIYGLSPQQLKDPHINIRAGIQFLDKLIEQYDGRIDLALSHYNGGSAVNRGGKKKVISYTRGYVLKVLDAAKRYRESQSVTPHQHTSTAVNWSTRNNVDAVVTNGNAPSASTKLRNDLDEVTFWLNASQLADLGFVLGAVSTSPSMKLTEKMIENRKNFRKWLSWRQQSR